MLKNHLDALPPTKFILLEDSLQEGGAEFLDYFVAEHSKKNRANVHYCVFQGNFKRTENKFRAGSGVLLHDFSSDCRDWSKTPRSKGFESVCSQLSPGDVVVADSLASAIYSHGFSEIYSVFNKLRQSTVLQVICVLHKDLLEDERIARYFEHLCSLQISLQPKFNGKSRLAYVYKKPGGKILSQLEEYRFENGNLICNKIEKPDPKKLLESSMKPEVNPESLSTFRIGLSRQEKVSRENLILPYLPKPENAESGKIFYEFDDVDDWDEEDPDDDLDI